MGKRSITVDTIKGVAIILVIIGHAIQYSFGFQENSAYLDNIVYKTIYSFHMPLFMLVSGYLSYGSISRLGTRELLCKRFKNYVVPVIFWGTISCVIKVLFFNERSVKTLLATYWGNFWFIWSVLIFSIFVSLVENKIKTHKKMVFISTMVLALITPDVAIQKYVFPFFLFGFYANKYGIIGRITKRHIITCAIICSLLFLILLPLFDRDKYIYISGFTLLKCNGLIEVVRQLYINLFRYLIGFVGSVSVIIILQLICKKVTVLARYIAPFGKSTISLYILSTLIFLYGFRGFNITMKYNPLNLFIITSFVIAASYIITHLLSKINTLRIIAFGR